MRFTDHPVTGNDYKRAKQLRRDSSPHESRLWFALRQATKCKSLKFRRQQPIHPYIVDFACMDAKLVVELDGMSHDARQTYDHKRDAYLRGKGFTVIRFSNNDVVENVAGVAETIIMEAEKLLSERENRFPTARPLP